MARALGQEIGLLLDQLVSDRKNGFLAQGDRADQTAAVANLIAQEGSRFRVHSVFPDHVFVKVIDAKAWQMLTGQAGAPAALFGALNDHVGQDVGIPGRVELASRIRREAADLFRRLSDTLNGGAQSSCDLRVALAGEIFQVILYNLVLQGLGAGGAL